MQKKKALIRKYVPHPDFRDYIRCYWTLDDADSSRSEIFCEALDGGLEMIFNFSDPLECRVDNSGPVMIGGDFMIGSLATRLRIKATGSVSLFGVRFSPEGLYPFFSMPPVDLSDFCIEIEEVWELRGLGVADAVHAITPVPENLIRTFESFFAQRMAWFRSSSLSVEKAVAAIRSHKGQISVRTLADHLRISSRHLERKFTERIGIPPKQLCRIFRLKHVLDRFRAVERDAASLAVTCGYFDQAHFINEFRMLTGMSPRAYSKQKRGLNPETPRH